MSTVSLITLFQARAETKPKPEVARAVICLITALGRSLAEFGGVIFLAMVIVYNIFTALILA